MFSIGQMFSAATRPIGKGKVPRRVQEKGIGALLPVIRIDAGCRGGEQCVQIGGGELGQVDAEDEEFFWLLLLQFFRGLTQGVVKRGLCLQAVNPKLGGPLQDFLGWRDDQDILCMQHGLGHLQDMMEEMDIQGAALVGV